MLDGFLNTLTLALKVYLVFLWPGFTYGLSLGGVKAKLGIEGDPQGPEIYSQTAVHVGSDIGEGLTIIAMSTSYPSQTVGLVIVLIMAAVLVRMALKLQSFLWPTIIFLSFGFSPFYLAAGDIAFFMFVGFWLMVLGPYIVFLLLLYKTLAEAL